MVSAGRFERGEQCRHYPVVEVVTKGRNDPRSRPLSARDPSGLQAWRPIGKDRPPFFSVKTSPVSKGI